ncbi:hypothetical protein DM02DRAFT_609198 [Periconia macrospinosa]|uniref:CAP-Gly domain-containing protein n=1 Tax=Periconia macrospinosa TaxID=97972 RepID=A0A2V1EC15_9PLEO|nr:hypothetical protein DM02DRAFT_609198 [Periconia macrospinosa]
MEFEVGDFVRTANNRQGTVRYIGGVTGKPDIWVGLELDGPEGKNDGSVQGERYFDCAPLHGIFTKYSDITQLIQSASAPVPSPSPAPRKPPSRLGAKPPAKAPATRPSSTTTTRPHRLSSVGSAAAGTRSPTKPASRLSGVASPTKPPPRRLSGVGAGAAAAAAKHPTQSRPSISQTRSPAVGTTRPTSQSARPSGGIGAAKPAAPQPSLAKRQSIGGSSTGTVRTGLTRKPSATGSSTSSLGGATRTAAPSSTTSAATSKTPKDPASQALETRVRQLEKQHTEQQATIEELMPYKAKSEKHEALALKVSKKYQDVHQELLEAKREATSTKAELEKAREEFEINLENAILDKETAEVERDQLSDQTEMLKATIEELQLDKEIYEAEAEASLIIDEDMSEEQAQTVHIRKLQAENKRLRAVIIDFRDIDKERQADTKRLRHELETTTEAAEESAKQCTELSLKVEQHESTITTLQEQLDANNEWEEILEDVTQRANNLEEKNMRQSLEIKELETVNEVSTETIAEYVEFTNDLQAEASLRETELAELSRELEQERIQNAQKDMTLAKYSEAFTDFQHQLQDQDMQQLMSEERAQGMTDKFNKMMDLHRTLQADRAKDTAKTIETELTKFSEQEAREELEILKNYLPETSTDYMDSSLRTYFRAKKIAYKASLIGSVLTGMETFTNEGTEKVLTNVYRHDTVYHLDYIRSHGEHFVATLANCTLEQFRRAVTEYEDISVVETTIERTLDNLKRDELNMKDLSESIRGTDKIMRGITSISQRLSGNRPENDLVLYVSLLRSSLERIRASFDAVKQYTQLVADFEPETEDRLDALVERLRKPQTSALECIAIVGKLSQALLTLQNDDLYPQFPSGAQEVLELSDNLSSYADKAHEFTRQVIAFDPNDEDETPSVNIDELTSTIDSAMNIFSPKDVDSLLKDIKNNVAHWFEYASILNNTAEIERLPSPWIVRAQEIEASKKHAIDSEKKLQLLTTEHQSTLIQIREREEIIDTKDLEIEHLRAKHKEAVARTEALDQLQKELQDAKTEQATYKREIKQHVDEIEQLKQSAAEALRSSPNASPNAAAPTENAAPTGTAATHKADKNKLELDKELLSGSFATFIKALKQENTWLRQREYATSMARATEFLPPLRKIPDSRQRVARAEELLEMAWSLQSPSSLDTVDDEETRPSSKKYGKPSSLLRIYDADISLVDDLCFVDLEPVADGFDELLLDEMMR